MGAEKETTTYEGWCNYETWTVDLWLNNEESSYRYWREQAKEQKQSASDTPQVRNGTWTAEEAAVYYLADRIKDEITESSLLREPSLYSDLLTSALSEVNWNEIAESLLSS